PASNARWQIALRSRPTSCRFPATSARTTSPSACRLALPPPRSRTRHGAGGSAGSATPALSRSDESIAGQCVPKPLQVLGSVHLPVSASRDIERNETDIGIRDEPPHDEEVVGPRLVEA